MQRDVKLHLVMKKMLSCVPGSIFLHLQINVSLFLFDKERDTPTGELTHTCAQWMGCALSISDHCCTNSLKRSWGRSRGTETAVKLINYNAEQQQCDGFSFFKTDVTLSNTPAFTDKQFLSYVKFINSIPFTLISHIDMHISKLIFTRILASTVKICENS